MRRGEALAHHHERGSAIAESGSVARRDGQFLGLHVLGGILGEGGAQLRECLEIRVFARALVGVDHRHPLLAGDLHRRDLGLELPALDRGHRLLMRFVRELVLPRPRDPGLLGGVLRVAAHVHMTERAPEAILDQAVGHRLLAELHAVAQPVHVVGRIAHGLHATGHEGLTVTGLDGLRREHHGLQPGSADLVDGVGGDMRRYAPLHGGLARGGLPHAGLHDIPHDHFVDQGDVDPAALQRRTDGDGPELGRGERCEAAEEASDRRAGAGDDDGSP